MAKIAACFSKKPSQVLEDTLQGHLSSSKVPEGPPGALVKAPILTQQVQGAAGHQHV